MYVLGNLYVMLGFCVNYVPSLNIGFNYVIYITKCNVIVGIGTIAWINSWMSLFP